MYDFSQKEWGLVLSGGGGKGAYQAGVFRALKEHKIMDYITAISGASVGALNLALFDCCDIEAVTDVWKNISPHKFLYPDNDTNNLNDGIFSRDGLLEIINNYINLEEIRNSERRLFVSVTEYEDIMDNEGKIKYFSLNYRPSKQIKDILLASSAIPVIYSSVNIDGKLYRDGGLKDNLPIRPLYIEGIRNFIVVGMSTELVINYDKYPDADFLVIKPRIGIGDFFDGTLDFSSNGAKKRMETGYVDAIRELEFYGRTDK